MPSDANIRTTVAYPQHSGGGAVLKSGVNSLILECCHLWLETILKHLLIFFTATLLASGCAALPLEGSRPAHHLEDGTFVNTDGVAINKSFSDLIRWNWERTEPERSEFPVRFPEPESLRGEELHQITWIGHSTFLIQSGGFNVLTDPHFSERASPFSFAGPLRVVPPAVALDDLPDIHAVVISHNHYDHLDEQTVRQLVARQPDHPPRFFVPLKLGEWFRDLGVESVVELDWWQSAGLGNLKIHAVPVRHWSARGLFDRNTSLWAGWVLDFPRQRIVHVGDSGYSADFPAIAERFPGIDLALIPVGAYDPRWFMKDAHMDPDEAVQVFKDLKATRAIGMHWGTFILTDEEMTAPPERLRAAMRREELPLDSFVVFQHGETQPLSEKKQDDVR